MKLEIYQGVNPDLKPDVIHENVWHMRVANDKKTVEIKIWEDHGQLRIAVDTQLVIEPTAANSINISTRSF